MSPVSPVSSFVAAATIAVLLCAGSSCRGRQPIAEGEGEGEGEGGFDDHTVAVLADDDGFFALARSTASSAAVKLVITRVGDDDRARVRFYDSAFYDLHDEWYWFRLLNGQGIDGLDDVADRPVSTSHGPFAAIGEVYGFARAEVAAGRPLPLDLRFLTTDERLYSPRFYDLALFNTPRLLGGATLLRFEATETREAVWAIEPEFSDPGDEATVRAFFAAVAPALPDDVAADLKWMTRSLQQAETAAAFPADLRGRVISFDDVITPGQTEVYSPGTTAGRLLLIRRGDEHLLQSARATDVVIVEDVPDALPPCAAFITASPQTALAHVNLLARNRGIPNAFRGGAVDDANLDQLARVRAPVAVRARLDGGGGGAGTLEIVAVSEADFAAWRTLTSPLAIRLPPVDLTDVPPVVDLAPLTFGEASALRPIVGGKAAGLVGLTSVGVSTVDAPVAVSIKPYVEHVTTTGLAERLPVILQDRSFAGDAIIRRLVLGGDRAVAPEVAASFRQSRPPGTLLRDIVDAGGVVGIMRDTPVAPATLAAITSHLEARFGRYADGQGLRFRSSSTIEDAEGFNGAGLYESHTGYLRPRAGDDGVDVALRKTWASYWGIEAFEERRLANADHESGAMAVVVHANFPDAREVDNGVALFTILPPRSQTARTPSGYVLEVNQQVGSLSVTNPPPGSPHLPEIDRVVVDVIDGLEQTPRI